MRILIAGGGTGGHLMPGVAIAEEILHRSPDHQVLFVIDRGPVGPRVLGAAGYSYRQISARGVLRRSARDKIIAVLCLALSLFESLKVLLSVRPQVVVGTGGYVCGPVLGVAWALRIPTVSLALDAIPSATVRLLARFSNEVHLAFPEAARFLPVGTALRDSGNPVRAGIGRADRTDGLRRFDLDPGKKTVFIFGGSQGAHSLNLAFAASLAFLTDLADSAQFLVQTGEKDLAAVQESAQGSPLKAEIRSFIQEMGEAYAVADLAVCRSGANTVAELAVKGLPAILVPFPYAAHGHQEANARSLERVGAVEVILDRDLDGARLAVAVRRLVTDEGRLAQMGRASKNWGRPDAGERIVDAVMTLGLR